MNNIPQKGNIPWNKGLKNWMSKEGKIRMIKSKIGKKHSFEHIQKIKNSCKKLVEEGRHNNYKASRNYRVLHAWVVRHRGLPTKCERCNIDGLKNKKINWANKSHNYLRDLSDWIRLCVKCHRKYDKKIK